MNFNGNYDIDEKDKTYYVLWVRHCLSCANVEKDKFKSWRIGSLKKMSLIEPLCTKKGMIQALVFGRELEKIINNLPDRIKYAINGVDMYASVLPRAVETAKLISIANMHLIDKPIYRMLYVQEEYKKTTDSVILTFNKDKGSANITNIEKSNCHAKLLNNIIGGAKVDGKILGCENIKCGVFKANTKTDLDNWKKNILTMLDSTKLNLIVSHHHAIADRILKFTKKKIKFDNLHAALVEYKYDFETRKVSEKFIMKIEVDPSKDYSKINIPDNKFFTCKYNYDKDIKGKYCNP